MSKPAKEEVLTASALIDALPGPTAREVGVGEHGSVRLVDVMPRMVQPDGLGPEAAIVQAARVSYGAGTKTVRSDEALLRYLFRHDHMTPFEMIVLKFRVCAPLFTARQWMRHRSGSFNEQSARYSAITPEFYMPERRELRVQSKKNKQGGGKLLTDNDAKAFSIRTDMAYKMTQTTYETSLKAGVVRELSRIVLPEGRYTTFYWTVNLRNLFGFLKLRLDAAAQGNIREYANGILSVISAYCPVAVKAFNDYQMSAISLTALEVEAIQSGETPKEMSSRERAEWAAKKQTLASGKRKAESSSSTPAAKRQA